MASGSIPENQSLIQSLKGGGQALSKNDRAFFEPRFGRDFSRCACVYGGAGHCFRGGAIRARNSIKWRPLQFMLADKIKPQINANERRFSGGVSAFICVRIYTILARAIKNILQPTIKVGREG
jgi:hypothetical protein